MSANFSSSACFLGLTKSAFSSARGGLAVGLALLLAASGVTGAAKAGPLPKERCSDLQALYMNLKKTEQVKQMSKGFEWVKANIKGDQLVTIKNFIETEEQLKFRCPGIRWINATPVFVGDVPKNRIPPLPQRKNPADEESYAPKLPPKPKRKDAAAGAVDQPGIKRAAATPKAAETQEAANPATYKPKSAPKKRPVAKKRQPKKKTAEPGFFDDFFAITGSVNEPEKKSNGKAAQKPAAQQTQWPFFLD